MMSWLTSPLAFIVIPEPEKMMKHTDIVIISAVLWFLFWWLSRFLEITTLRLLFLHAKKRQTLTKNYSK